MDEISELLVKNAAARSAAKNCSYAVMTLLQLVIGTARKTANFLACGFDLRF